MTSIAQFGDFSLDLDRGRLVRAGKPIALRATPLKLLIELIRANGKTLSKEDLRSRVWLGRTVDLERSLHTAVKQVRHALNDDPQDPRYVRTEPRRGYRFIAPVVLGATVDPGRGRRSQELTVVAVAVAAAVTLTVALLGVTLLVFNDRPTAQLSKAGPAGVVEKVDPPVDAAGQRRADREARRRLIEQAR